MHLMLSWWERNIVYKYYSISKDEIYIIRSSLGEYGSYGSNPRTKFPGHNSHTGPRGFKSDNVTPI